MRMDIGPGRLFALGMLATLGLLLPTHASELPLPQRKPGMWRLTSISAELGMTTIETCIGSEDSIAAPPMGGRAAPQPSSATTIR